MVDKSAAAPPTLDEQVTEHAKQLAELQSWKRFVGREHILEELLSRTPAPAGGFKP
jgi:hypothetical protein